jgi:hypothetical protein
MLRNGSDRGSVFPQPVVQEVESCSLHTDFTIRACSVEDIFIQGTPGFIAVTRRGQSPTRRLDPRETLQLDKARSCGTSTSHIRGHG